MWQHESDTLGCAMKFAIYLPPQASTQRCSVLFWLSALTCSEQNFTTKAHAQMHAAKHGVIVVAPDTTPRGDDVPDDDAYDLGKGAGFYVNATREPWAKNYQMHDYVTRELVDLIDARFPTNGKRGIFGHSMGRHGAMVLALRNPGVFSSVSAFSPIVAPASVPWGHKAFSAYLGDDRQTWSQWDTCELVFSDVPRLELFVDQGLADNFLANQLKPELLEEACQKARHPLRLRRHEGYDHSYYFIATFLGDHFDHHMRALA